MARASQTHEYNLRVKNVNGMTLRGRLNQETHAVLCDTATGPVYAQPGDLILILPNEHSLVLRKADYPYLVNVLPTPRAQPSDDDASAATPSYDENPDPFAPALAGWGH